MNNPFISGILDKFNLNNKKKLIPVIIILVLFVINSISMGLNIQTSENPLRYQFTVDSVNPIPKLYSFSTNAQDVNNLNKFEFYNHSILTIYANTAFVYTYDKNFKSVLSTHAFTFNNLSISDRLIGNRPPESSQLVNAYTDRITTDAQHTFILGNYIANGSWGYYNLPRIEEYGGFNSTNFTVFQSQLHVPCPIPSQIEKYYPNLCYPSEIKLLNSSELLLLQNYVNTNNNNYDQNFNPYINVYGTSLVFYNLKTKTILKSIILPEGDIIDYQYICLPNSHDIWIYFTNIETHESGYISVNQQTDTIMKEYTSNLNSLNKYHSEANYPLIINSKILIFYQTDGYLNNYIWYSSKLNYSNTGINLDVYLLIIVYVIFNKRINRIIQMIYSNWRDS